MSQMKAVIWTAYGGPDVLRLDKIDIPKPKDNELLIKVVCSSVTKGDCETRELDLPIAIRTMMKLVFGIRKPKRVKIPGQEFAGIVEKIGKSVNEFKEGDRVFGSRGIMMGAYAEYLCIQKAGGTGCVSHIPDKIDYRTAAVLTTGGMEAMHFFGKSGIKKGDNVLINGAGGSIGLVFLQMAKNTGAVVTAVDMREKLYFLKSLGADRTIDYKKKDYTDEKMKYDVVFDVVGSNSIKRNLKVLRKGGRYLLGNPTFSKIVISSFINIISGKKVVVGAAEYTVNKLGQMAEMVADGKITIIIDREFQLEDIVKAHEYVDSDMKVGNVVVAI